jgi:hypothetical protein
MAKNVRISDEIYLLAQVESRLELRSIAQQLEFWAKLGMAATRAGRGTASALEAALESTRRLDVIDVQTGKRDASSLHFVPQSIARESKLLFPGGYRKS